MKVTIEKTTDLLEVLEGQFPDSSKTTLRKMVEQQRVRVNGEIERVPRRRLAKGDMVEVGGKQMANFLPPELQLLYEDDDLLVVNKASGLLTVSTEAEQDQTVQRYLNEYLRAKKKGRVHPVHRLDRDTSGVMMFAKTFPAKEKLKNKFAAHDIERAYVAVVEGRLTPRKGSVKTFLYEDATFTVRITDDATRGKPAVTHYEVTDSGDHYSLVEVTLETGRKNQIRVHLSSLGHPVAGDAKYGAKTNPLGRLGLHAKLLGFDHPTTGKHMVFTAPLPDVFRHVHL